MKGVEGGDWKRGVGGERRRQKSLRIGVHHANGVVWGPVYRTHLRRARGERGRERERDRARERTNEREHARATTTRERSVQRTVE